MKTAWKLMACWAAFVVALMATGAVMQVLHLQPVSPADATPMATQMFWQMLSGAVLVLGLYPLARSLAGSFAMRAAALGGFIFLVLGINGTIEGKFFTHLLDGKVAAATTFFIILALLLGGTMAWSFGTAEHGEGLAQHGPTGWAGRGVVAWLSWPVIYLAFGICVAPIVVPYYTRGAAGLTIPPLDTIVELQLFRSVIFLAATLPLIALWKGSRMGLWVALGLTHAVVVGVYGLVGATFLPWVLRVAHSLEITGDSFAYAGLLVLLFAPHPGRQEAPSFKEPHAQPL
ncbi:MAG TPA: hypothetical protein VMV57_16380 [Terracidiphilus sp.]|nr:hypothetical protein [Terracidiphilus sp.]